jgi:O-acetyl-ADP-ribose deacetylase (regulator of RNase III)
MLIYKQGNLLDLAEQGEFNIIIHGCNCFNTMGSGIAKQIKERYPLAYEADQMTVSGDKTKLGTISCALVDNNIGGKFIVVNAYTQYSFNTQGSARDLFEYQAFEKILNAFAVDASQDMHIGMPYIGMGLAGGSKDRIIKIIEDFASKISSKGATITLVEYNG